jgi:hypothetical protein
MWHTFFDAVIMTEVKRRPLRLPELPLALPRSYCDGTGDSRDVCCACASRSRNGTRVRRLYAVGEGSPTASGGDASLEVIGPLLPLVCCCNYCRPASGHMCLSLRLTDP